MVRRPTWILLGLFALLVGFAWLFQRYQTNKTNNIATATPTTAAQKLYGISDAQLNDVKVSAVSGGGIELYRDPGSSNWAIMDVPVDQANSTLIENLIKQLLAIPVKESLSQTTPLDAVGLGSPAYSITMTTTDTTIVVTEIGTLNAIGDGYYVRIDSGQVMLVGKTVVDDVIALLTNPPLLPTATPEVTPTGTVTPIGAGDQSTPTP